MPTVKQVKPMSATDTSSNERIESIVQAEFNRCGYRALRSVWFHYDGGVLSLRGQVPTYHMKQVAVALVRRACGDITIHDQLEVVSNGKPLTQFSSAFNLIGRNTMRTSLFLVLVACLAVTGCSNSTGDATIAANSTQPEDQLTQEDVRAETKQAFETAQEFAQQQEEKYRQQVAARLDKIQQHIDALKRQLENAAPTTGAGDLQKMFERMEQQLADVRTQAAEQKTETRQTWNELRSAVDEAIDELEASAEDVRKQIEPDDKNAVDAPETPNTTEDREQQ